MQGEYSSILDDREFDIEDDGYTKREDDMSLFNGRDFEFVQHDRIKELRDDSDLHMLYRRKSIFTKIKEGFKKFGHAIKKGFQKAGHAIKAGFKKVGHALKTGFQKVGKFIKKTAGKIAKFGLKVVAAVATVASKVVKFIPGVGEGLSIAIKGAAIGANAASNKIHANMGKLDKVSKGLDYVISPMVLLQSTWGRALASCPISFSDNETIANTDNKSRRSFSSSTSSRFLLFVPTRLRLQITLLPPPLCFSGLLPMICRLQ